MLETFFLTLHRLRKGKKRENAMFLLNPSFTQMFLSFSCHLFQHRRQNFDYLLEKYRSSGFPICDLLGMANRVPSSLFPRLGTFSSLRSLFLPLLLYTRIPTHVDWFPYSVSPTRPRTGCSPPSSTLLWYARESVMLSAYWWTSIAPQLRQQGEQIHRRNRFKMQYPQLPLRRK